MLANRSIKKAFTAGLISFLIIGIAPAISRPQVLLAYDAPASDTRSEVTIDEDDSDEALTEVFPPTNVIASAASTTTVNIAWVPSSGSQFVQVWRTHKANAEQKDYVLLGTYYAADGKSVSKSLTPGQTYYYKLRSYTKFSDGKKVYSRYSEVVSATTKSAVPAAPSRVSATASSATTVDIAWTPSEGSDFVQVWRTHKANAEQKDYVLIGTYRAKDGNSVSKSLTPNKTYYYKLRSYKKFSDGRKVYSGYSSVVKATPKVDAPESLSVTRVTKDSIGLRWSPVSGSNIMYEVWRLSSSSATPGVCLGRYSGTEKISTNLKSGTIYYYRVRAYYYYIGADKQAHRIYGPYSNMVNAVTLKNVSNPVVNLSKSADDELSEITSCANEYGWSYSTKVIKNTSSQYGIVFKGQHADSSDPRLIWIVNYCIKSEVDSYGVITSRIFITEDGEYSSSYDAYNQELALDLVLSALISYGS